MTFSRVSVAGLEGKMLADTVERNFQALESHIKQEATVSPYSPHLFAYNTQNGAVSTSWEQVPFDEVVLSHEDFLFKPGSDVVLCNFTGAVELLCVVASTTSSASSEAHLRVERNSVALGYAHADFSSPGATKAFQSILSGVVVKVSRGDKLSIGFYHSSSGGTYVAGDTYLHVERVA